MKYWIFGIVISLLFFAGCSNTAVSVWDGVLRNETATPLSTTNRALDVSVQDGFTEVIDLRMSQFVSNMTLLNNYSEDEYFINVSSTTVPTVEHEVEINHDHKFYQAEILQVVSLGGNNYQLLLDKPLDEDFTTTSHIELVNTDWAVSGSLANPVIFDVGPGKLTNTSWDITRFILTCIGDGAGASNDGPDLSTFFTMNPITNGIIFREVDGETINIFNAKDNFHLNSEAYDLTIYPASRTGLYGVAVRRSFNGPDKNGVVIRLRSETDDTFQLIVRDNLLDMEECHAVVQGHTVER